MANSVKADISIGQENYLSEEEVDNINKRVSNFFVQEGEKVVQIKVADINNEIEKMIQEIKLEKVKVGSN